jgi:hypothetical protein
MYQPPHLHSRMHLVYTRCALGARLIVCQVPHLRSRIHLVCACCTQAPHVHSRMPLVCPWCALGVPSVCPRMCQAPRLHTRMHLVYVCCVSSPPFVLQDALQQVHLVSCYATGGLGAPSAHQASKRIPTGTTRKHTVSDSTISTVMHRFSSEHRS